MSVQIVNMALSVTQSWTRYARCAEYGAPGMFPSDQDEVGIELAKQTCDGCPVKALCLADAMDRGEQWGVWGGLTTSERQAMRRNEQRRAARQTKIVTAQDLADIAAMDGAA